jgi:hypothetical protein
VHSHVNPAGGWPTSQSTIKDGVPQVSTLRPGISEPLQPQITPQKRRRVRSSSPAPVPRSQYAGRLPGTNPSVAECNGDFATVQQTTGPNLHEAPFSEIQNEPVILLSASRNGYLSVITSFHPPGQERRFLHRRHLHEKCGEVDLLCCAFRRSWITGYVAATPKASAGSTVSGDV